MKVKSVDLNSMVRCVGNFGCQHCNGTMFVIAMRSNAAGHQFVSDGHVDNVRRRQLELERIDIDVAQHEPHKLIFSIVTVLHRCRQHADSSIISIEPAKRLLQYNRFNSTLNIY